MARLWTSGQACNATEFECVQDGKRKCLDPALRCDMHPQCDGGEDEQACEASYRKRGYISNSATYRCESPHHHQGSGRPVVTTWATPCDGRRECYGGSDEEGCDNDWIVYIALGGGTYIANPDLYLFVVVDMLC